MPPWISITFLCLSLLPFQALGVGIMVDEFNVGSGPVVAGMASDEYIEFVITQSTTAAQLASMTFGDTNSSTSQLQSAFQFNLGALQTALAGSGLSAFVPGTVIVVKGAGLGSQDLSYDPTASNVGNAGAWNIELVAGQGAVKASGGPVTGNFAPNTNGDVVWISSKSPTSKIDTSGIVSAIGYDNSPGNIASSVISQLGSGNILRTTVASGSSISNVGGATTSLVASSTGTMGVANGGVNGTFVSGLQQQSALALAPEPGRMGLLGFGAIVALARRRRKKGGCNV